MKSESKLLETKRHNRIDIELRQFISPFDYVLLDTLLYKSNLTKANNGDGFKFHITTLAEDLNMSEKTIERRFKTWPFITKHGATKGSNFVFDYQGYLKYAQRLQTPCPTIPDPKSEIPFTITDSKSEMIPDSKSDYTDESTQKSTHNTKEENETTSEPVNQFRKFILEEVPSRAEEIINKAVTVMTEQHLASTTPSPTFLKQQENARFPVDLKKRRIEEINKIFDN